MGLFSTQARQIVRRLARAPMFTAVTVITLAIGIGANTAIFSVLNGILLKPLPYSEPERLVAVWQTAPGLGIPEINASPATYFTYREEGRTFEDIGIWRSEAVSVTGLAEPERVEALSVSDGVLPILRVRPALGRWFTRTDDSPGTPETVMLTYGYWQQRFGGDANVIGRRILLDGRAREVIGVMPRDFRFLDERASVLVPLRLDRNETFVGNFSFQTLARLKPGVTIEQASADVARMIPMMSRKFKPAPGMSSKMLEEARMGPNLRPLKNDVVGDIGKVLWVLVGTVGMVLFIACANVANLLLVQAEGRQQELAIRAALGAGWHQIARQLLVESVALGLMGGVLGLGLAQLALELLVAIGPANLPRLDEISIDPRVLLFTLAVSLLSGVLFGLMPVLKYATPRLNTALRAGGRTSSQGRERHRARSVLVVVQVALALVLLISSGLMIRTLGKLKQVQPGFTNPEEIQTFRISIPKSVVAEEGKVPRLYQELLDRVQAVPGVSSAALTNSITMDGNYNNDPIFAEDRVYSESQLPPLRRYKYVSPGSFATMGNPLLAGRDLSWTDIHEQRSVLLVSENLARELWGSPGAAVGKRVRENPKGTWREVIGVAGNERDNGAHEAPPTVVYWPTLIKNYWGQEMRAQRSLAFVVRSPRAGSPSFLTELRTAIWSLNPELPVSGVRTVKEIYDRSMARTSFTLVMLSMAAGMALLLGVVGIYGVIAYSVSQRTREIGIRMALGAPHSQVRSMFVRHGLVLAGIGLVAGLATAAALTRLMSALLFGVSPLDPVTYGLVSLVLGSAALLASYVPARRATVIDPVEALRAE